jgi:outer membrane autotransporter protein
VGPFLDPTQANAIMFGIGYTQPPWDTHTQVTLITNTQTLYFARFYTPPGSSKYGSWVMRAASIRGLTAAQIKNLFSLQSLPTGIAYAVAPAGHVLWTGIAGPIAGWGAGGGEQTFLDNSYVPPITFYSKNLTGGALLYAPIAGGRNAGKAASYLDSIIPSSYQDRITPGRYSRLDPYLGPLDVLSFGAVSAFNAALNQIGPERYDAITQIGVRNGIQFGRAVSLHDRTGPSVRIDPHSDIELWATGIGEFGMQGGSGEHTGFNYDTGGAVMGVDLFRAGDTSLGVAAGFLRTNLDWKNSGGEANIDNPRLGIYGNYEKDSGLFLGSLLAGGQDGITGTRTIAYPGVNQGANMDFSGRDLMLQVNGGYTLRVRDWSVSPITELSYFYMHQSGLTETGADALDLVVRSRDDQTFRSQLGVRVEGVKVVAGTPVTPSLEVGWAHEIPLNGRAITSSLVDQPGTFSVNGWSMDTDTLVVDAGVKAQLTTSTDCYARYEAEVGDHFTSHQISAGLRKSF